MRLYNGETFQRKWLCEVVSHKDTVFPPLTLSVCFSVCFLKPYTSINVSINSKWLEKTIHTGTLKDCNKLLPGGKVNVVSPENKYGLGLISGLIETTTTVLIEALCCTGTVNAEYRNVKSLI